jgi:hypothetical protein
MATLEMAAPPKLVAVGSDRLIQRGVPKGNHAHGHPTERAFRLRPNETGLSVFLHPDMDSEDLRRRCCPRPNEIQSYGVAKTIAAKVTAIDELTVVEVPDPSLPGHSEIRSAKGVRDPFTLPVRVELAAAFNEWIVSPG